MTRVKPPLFSGGAPAPAGATRQVQVESGSKTAGQIDAPDQRLEAIVLPQRLDPTQGELKVQIDPSLAAGMVDAGDTPSETMKREIWEEVGYRVSKLQHIGTYYMSPGGSSERIHLYYAAVDQSDKGSDGGGKLSEGEDVLVKRVPADQALEDLGQGKILDAKTAIALQWLALSRETL